MPVPTASTHVFAPARIYWRCTKGSDDLYTVSNATVLSAVGLILTLLGGAIRGLPHAP